MQLAEVTKTRARGDLLLGSPYDVRPGRCDLGERDDIDRAGRHPRRALTPATGPPSQSPAPPDHARAHLALPTPWLSSALLLCGRPAGWIGQGIGQGRLLTSIIGIVAKLLPVSRSARWNAGKDLADGRQPL